MPDIVLKIKNVSFRDMGRILAVAQEIRKGQTGAEGAAGEEHETIQLMVLPEQTESETAAEVRTDETEAAESVTPSELSDYAVSVVRQYKKAGQKLLKELLEKYQADKVTALPEEKTQLFYNELQARAAEIA